MSNKTDPHADVSFDEYVDSLLAEHAARQENRLLLQHIERQTIELRRMYDEMQEIRQQNAAIVRRLDVWENRLDADAPARPTRDPPPEPMTDPPPWFKRPLKLPLKWPLKLPSISLPRGWRFRPASAIAGLLMTLCALLLAATLAVFGQSSDISKNFFGLRYNIINAPNMIPDFPVGSLVITRATADIRPDDDITIKLSETVFLTTRVVEVLPGDDGEPRFLTRGINNQAVDAAPYPIDRVAGKVILCVPRLGGFLRFLKANPAPMAALMAAMLGTSVLLKRRPAAAL